MLYLNGEEIKRERMAPGAVGHNTFAHSAISSANAQADPVVVDLPVVLLKPGVNTIVASVHANSRATPNRTFGMTATVVQAAAELEPAPDPTPEPGQDPGLEPILEPLAWADPAWDYWYDAEAPVSHWNSPLDEGQGLGAAWDQAIAPFGFGNSIALETQLTKEFELRPAALYTRREFTVDHLLAHGVVRLETWADDGMALYLNGQEVTRERMADGPVGHATFAHGAISSKNALAEPVVVEIPVREFVDGANVLAASIHANYRATPTLSFGLNATFEPSE